MIDLASLCSAPCVLTGSALRSLQVLLIPSSGQFCYRALDYVLGIVLEAEDKVLRAEYVLSDLIKERFPIRFIPIKCTI